MLVSSLPFLFLDERSECREDPILLPPSTQHEPKGLGLVGLPLPGPHLSGCPRQPGNFTSIFSLIEILVVCGSAITADVVSP